MDEVQNQIKEMLETIQTQRTHCENLENTMDVKKSEEKQLLVEGKASLTRLSMCNISFSSIYSYHC